MKTLRAVLAIWRFAAEMTVVIAVMCLAPEDFGGLDDE